MGVDMVNSLTDGTGNSVRRSERDRFVGQLLRLMQQVVARSQASDEPRFLGHRTLGGQHPNRHGAASAVVGQSGIVTLTAGVLATPELLVTTPGLEMASQRLIQTVGVRFADVHDGIAAVSLAFSDEVHAGLAAQRADP